MRVNTLYANRLGGAFGKRGGGGAAVVAGGREERPKGRLGDALKRGSRGAGPGRVARAGAAAGSAMAAYDIAMAIWAGEEVSAEDIGAAVGTIAGTAVGAAAGSPLGPAGTVGGGAVGSVAGEAIGREVGEWFGETFGGPGSPGETGSMPSRAEMLHEMRVAAELRNAQPAPEVVRERARAGGRGTYGRSVSYSPRINITVNSNAKDNEKVARLVVEKMERRIADDSRTLEDHVVADPPFEVQY